MLDPEHEKTLQELFHNMDEAELTAVFGLATHIDEMATDRAHRCTADAEHELKSGEPSPLRVGYHYGEAAGTIKASQSAVDMLGRLMSVPFDPSG